MSHVAKIAGHLAFGYPNRNPDNQNPRPPSKTEALGLRMLAGSACGLGADAVTFPFLVLQTRRYANDAVKVPPIGIVRAVHKLITTEGIHACFSGFSAVAVGSVIGTGAYCVGSEATRKYLGEGNVANLAAGYAGQAAGSIFAWTKVAVISEVQQAPPALKHPKFHNKGAIQIARLIIQQNGLLAPWTGLGIQFVNFGTINGLGEYFAGILRNAMKGSDNVNDPSFLQKFIINAASWGGAAAVSAPLGMIKLRLQLNGMSPEHFPHRSSLACAKHVWKNEGIRGLYAGTKERVFAITPRAALFFTTMPYVYEALCKHFNFKV
jgi:hypothetical protein